MSEKKTSQAQQNTSPWNDLLAPSITAWRTLAEETLTHLQGVWDQGADLEGRVVERTTAAIDQGAELMREAVASSQRLAAQWRDMARQATDRAVSQVRESAN